MNASKHETASEISDAQLLEMFEAYAGPAEAKADPARARRRISSKRVAMAIAAAAVVGVASLLAIVVQGEGRSTTTSAATVPEVLASPVHAPFRELPLNEMIGRSDLIFVGTVRTIERPAEISPADPADNTNPLVAYRVFFQTQDVLRGTSDTDVIIIDPAIGDTADGRAQAGWFTAEVGEKYLVFAEWKQLESEGAPVLVPVGLDLGVFQFTSSNAATNSRAVTLQLDEVERLVNEAP